MMCTVSAVLFLGLLPAASGAGDGFLSARIDRQSIHMAIQGALADSLGSGHGVEAARLTSIKAVLTPLFDVLPKNRLGHLNAPFMRYAVQRYFSQTRGWMVKGFAPSGSSLNASDAVILESKVPDYVQAALEKTLSQGGFALQDLVVAVASIERLIFNEVSRGVETAFSLNELPLTEPIRDKSTMTDVLVSYFAVEHLQGNSTNVKRHRFERKNIARFYPYWLQTYDFIQDTAGNDAFQMRETSNPFAERSFAFEEVARISGHVNEDFGVFSRHECDDIKNKLSEKDIYGTGRVKLADFYGAGAWQFRESPEYLKLIGALDESSASQGPQVIIPNYVLGMNNCITSTLYYNICCLNECDGVFEHLESRIRSPTASAAEITRAVEDGITESYPVLSSTASTGSRNLTASLRARLQEIAVKHGDAIPLHGRLLGQWLHYVYPRECPFPHMSGTVDQKSPNEAAKANVRVRVSKDEMRQLNESEFHKVAPSPEAGLGMWSSQEELIDVAAQPSGLRMLFGPALKVALVMSSAALVMNKVTRMVSYHSGPSKHSNAGLSFSSDSSYDI